MTPAADFARRARRRPGEAVPPASPARRARALRRRSARRRRAVADDAEAPFRVARAEELLVELADARLRHLVDEGPALGHPPLRDATREERLQCLDGDAG